MKYFDIYSRNYSINILERILSITEGDFVIIEEDSLILLAEGDFIKISLQSILLWQAFDLLCAAIDFELTTLPQIWHGR